MISVRNSMELGVSPLKNYTQYTFPHRGFPLQVIFPGNHLTSANEAYECDSSWTDADGNGPGSVTQDDIDRGRCKKESYTKCYRGGSACPNDHSVCKVTESARAHSRK